MVHPTGHRFSFSQLRRIVAYEDIAIHTYRSRLLRFGVVCPPGEQDECRKDRYGTVTAIVVTRTKVDTLIMLSPQPYIALASGDTIKVDGCRHAKEAKVYTDDSTYTAWVSGVRPSLDSIRTYRHTQYVDRYIYRDVIHQPKSKRWGIGLNAGYGIGKGGLSPVLAVTVNWNLFQW